MCVLEGGGGGGVSLWYLGDLYVRARVRAAQTVLNRYGGSAVVEVGCLHSSLNLRVDHTVFCYWSLGASLTIIFLIIYRN